MLVTERTDSFIRPKLLTGCPALCHMLGTQQSVKPDEGPSFTVPQAQRGTEKVGGGGPLVTGELSGSRRIEDETLFILHTNRQENRGRHLVMGIFREDGNPSKDHERHHL